MYNHLIEELSLFSSNYYKRSVLKPCDNGIRLLDSWALRYNDLHGYTLQRSDIKTWINSGVYMLLDDSSNPDDPIMYIGQSKNIYRRVLSHVSSKKSAFNRIRNIDIGDEKPLAIHLSHDIQDERHYYRLASEHQYFRLINDPTKLLKYSTTTNQQ